MFIFKSQLIFLRVCLLAAEGLGSPQFEIQICVQIIVPGNHCSARRYETAGRVLSLLGVFAAKISNLEGIVYLVCSAGASHYSHDRIPAFYESISGSGWIGSTQKTFSGSSTTGMSKFTTTGSWSLRTRTHSKDSSSFALIS